MLGQPTQGNTDPMDSSRHSSFEMYRVACKFSRVALKTDHPSNLTLKSGAGIAGPPTPHIACCRGRDGPATFRSATFTSTRPSLSRT